MRTVISGIGYDGYRYLNEKYSRRFGCWFFWQSLDPSIVGVATDRSRTKGKVLATNQKREIGGRFPEARFENVP